ncbi:hypothetical protein CLOSTASPAR_04488 [[Clostridium] asparagiforme DSM 15981]|uniref:Uncharacterized protein n=1 Tax=[Clostridium] asparagiforme DSM 15981 TaxID=518636 RepID=C0D5E2_9FIRM|nr:hypothetical protein CLOSTASPAR_04488 [[Clostridium] asparagiforme DSM 15981]
MVFYFVSWLFCIYFKDNMWSFQIFYHILKFYTIISFYFAVKHSA